MKMKKMLLGAFLGIFTLAGIAILPNYASATDYGNNGGNNSNPTSGTWDTPTGKNMITNKDQSGSQLLTTIQSTIKWILWFLATIAVVICLYWGFLMMTSAGDENKYKKGITVLKYAAIWLAVIGLSWIIVSAIFWFVGLQGGQENVMTN